MIRTIEDIAGTIPTPKSKRILAFDLIRGFLLVVILIDHVELYPSLFDLFTGRGRLFVSAAEGFFFLSGLLIGMVYKRRLSLGMKFIFKKMWSRALELYLASVALTLGYTYWAIKSGHTFIKYGLPDPINWHHTIMETLLMRYGFGWADFLARFVILMLIAPFVFYLIAHRKWWLAAAGILVAWLFRGQSFTLSWQIIFNGGILAGYYWNEVQAWLSHFKAPTKRSLKKALSIVAAITFAVSWASVYLLSLLNQKLVGLPAWLAHFTTAWNHVNYDIWVYAQKWTIGSVRILLFALWFMWLFMWVNKHEDKINKFSKGVLELLGRNSLFVYIWHSLIIFVFKLFIPPITPLWENFLITFAALVVLIAGTAAYRQLRTTTGHQNGSFYRLLVSKTKGFFAQG